MKRVRLNRLMWLLQQARRFLPPRSFSSVAPTIFALSSGQGKCGVAVIRISGPNAGEAILKMTSRVDLPRPRTASLHIIRDPETLEELDKGLVLWFPGPKSFTGEDSCEFQVHGGPAVISSVLGGLSKIEGFRSAEAGEFTRRAFFAGKLDLTEVEGLADLIHAETELQRKQALYQMEGNLSAVYKRWRERLKKSLAHVEAFIDFGEDDNIENDVLELTNKELKNFKKEIEAHLNDGRRGERLRDGIKVTIIGEPNAGKSSLLNAICQRPAAIVTPIPGTTRDLIEVHQNLSGFPITVTDTAGLRSDTSDVVEREGISRAHGSIEHSDLGDFMNFLTRHLESLNLKMPMEKIIGSIKNDDSTPKFLFILNKIDLLGEAQRAALQRLQERKSNVNFISCKTEEGFGPFLAEVTATLRTLCANPSRESPSITQTRHRHHLNKCLEHLNEYFATVNTDITVAAQKLRLSLRHLGKIIGTVSNEEILDVIFRDFCIGK